MLFMQRDDLLPRPDEEARERLIACGLRPDTASALARVPGLDANLIGCWETHLKKTHKRYSPGLLFFALAHQAADFGYLPAHAPDCTCRACTQNKYGAFIDN